jgi:hypothetical protein
LGRHLGGNKAVVGVFNGPVVYVNAGVALIFLARAVALVKNFASSSCFGKKKKRPLNTVKILYPGANLSSSHKKQTTSIPI